MDYFGNKKNKTRKKTQQNDRTVFSLLLWAGIFSLDISEPKCLSSSPAHQRLAMVIISPSWNHQVPFFKQRKFLQPSRGTWFISFLSGIRQNCTRDSINCRHSDSDHSSFINLIKPYDCGWRCSGRLSAPCGIILIRLSSVCRSSLNKLKVRTLSHGGCLPFFFKRFFNRPESWNEAGN